METTKTTKEALQILGRYIGQEINIKYIDRYRESNGYDYISTGYLKDVEDGIIKSFRITSLRSLEEMIEEEKHKYGNLQKEVHYTTNDSDTWDWHDTPESIHYLESIGIDTMNLKDVTIFIKD